MAQWSKSLTQHDPSKGFTQTITPPFLWNTFILIQNTLKLVQSHTCQTKITFTTKKAFGFIKQGVEVDLIKPTSLLHRFLVLQILCCWYPSGNRLGTNVHWWHYNFHFLPNAIKMIKSNYKWLRYIQNRHDTLKQKIGRLFMIYYIHATC